MNSTGVANDDVLYIRCSDGRTKRPENIFEKCTHQVRKAGGVLNALFKSRFSRVQLPLEVREDDQMEDIETMILLKKPKKIIVASHSHCGAAQALGLTHTEILSIHENWGQRIRNFYPHADVEVLHEDHSPCGNYRDWELVIQMAAEESPQQATQME